MTESTTTPAATPPLSRAGRQRAVLDFEAEHPRRGPVKDAAIRRAFGWPPIRYYQVLADAVSTAPAAAVRPEVVGRCAAAAGPAVEHRSAGATPAAPTLW